MVHGYEVNFWLGPIMGPSCYTYVQGYTLLFGSIQLRMHTVLFFKIYAIKIGHQFRARGIIGIGQDYMSSEYEQIPTSLFTGRYGGPV